MPVPDEISAAVARLRAGGVVAFPTETVYGLGADALNTAAISRVFALKGRPSHNPLLVHVSSAAMARPLVLDWPGAAELLARAFWPGPLSIILPKAACIPGIVTGRSSNVGLRCPDHPLTLALLEAFGGPLVGPSANPSGRVSPTTAAHVRESFSEDDVSVLDGGACREGIESTVLSLAGARPEILRPGMISAEQIAAVLGRAVTVREAEPDASAVLDSPGLLSSHYAPLTRAVLFDVGDLPRLLDQGTLVVLAHENLAVPAPHARLRLPDDARGYAANIYAALREADRLRPTLIAVLRPPTGGPDGAVWSAILDRLTRATAR